MDCKLSSAASRLADVRESIRGGNWETADASARGLAGCDLPQMPDELSHYLEALIQTVVLARAARSVTAASLARVRAAATFHSGDHL